MDICVIVTFLFAFQISVTEISFVVQYIPFAKTLFRKNGVLFTDLSNCCDGLLSSQRLLLKTNCENSLLVNRSNDVKIDSIYSRKFIIKFVQEISEILKKEIGG